MTISAFGNVTTTGNITFASIGNTAVTWMSICNYSSNTVSANVYVVPSGDTAGNNNIVLSQLILASGNGGGAGGDTYQMYSAAEKLLLGNGDSIQVSSNANSAITVVTSYTTL
jgi:hypothetical protein